MCNSSISSDYAPMFKGEIQFPPPPLQFAQNARFKTLFLKSFSARGALLRPSRTLPATKPRYISTPVNKDTPLAVSCGRREFFLTFNKIYWIRSAFILFACF